MTTDHDGVSSTGWRRSSFRRVHPAPFAGYRFMQYCFRIDTEQATWKEVRRGNFEVNEVKGASQSDKELARSLTPRRRKT